MIVVDASFIIDFLIEALPQPAKKRFLFRRAQLHAPHLIDLEIVNAFRREVLAGELEESLAFRLLRGIPLLPVLRHRHDAYVARIWAFRHNVTANDAAYVALAEGLDCPLVTRDAKLAKAVQGQIAVELV